MIGFLDKLIVFSHLHSIIQQGHLRFILGVQFLKSLDPVFQISNFFLLLQPFGLILL